MWSKMTDHIRDYLQKYGCFCGGKGQYTDYNCGVGFLVTCPHCQGSGKRRERCKCQIPELRCP